MFRWYQGGNGLVLAQWFAVLGYEISMVPSLLYLVPT